MQIIFFSSNQDMIQEWKKRHDLQESHSVYDLDSLHDALKDTTNSIVICDYDSIAHDVNTLIASNALPLNCAILESAPALSTGKLLISHGVKAYGNSRMLSIHYLQMIKTLEDGNVWTYPELTASLILANKKPTLSSDAKQLINTRLTEKEQEVLYCVLDGLTNEAIANKLTITLRTAKAHVSAIFSKLHVNDRISLVLLLK